MMTRLFALQLSSNYNENDMEYQDDKDVVFALMQRVDYNKTWEQIEFDLGYDMGDYNFGKGDGEELRTKIVASIKFMKSQFDGVFNDEGNTSKPPQN